MARHVGSKTKYPDDWEAIAYRRKCEENWRCERDGCRVAHDPDPKTGNCLTVHHLDGDKTNNADWNLAVLCQRCHLVMQQIVMDQMLLPLFVPSPWFMKHLDGYNKTKAG